MKYIIIILIMIVVDFSNPQLMIKFIDLYHELLHLIGNLLSLRLGYMSVSSNESYYYSESYSVICLLAPFVLPLLVLLLEFSKNHLKAAFLRLILLLFIILSGCSNIELSLADAIIILILLLSRRFFIFVNIITLIDFIIIGH